MAVVSGFYNLVMRADRLKEVDPELFNQIKKLSETPGIDDYDGKLCRYGFGEPSDGKRLLDKLHAKGLREPDLDDEGFIDRYNDYVLWPDPFHQLPRPTTEEELKDYVYPSHTEQSSSVCDWAVYNGWFGYREPGESVESALERLKVETKNAN